MLNEPWIHPAAIDYTDAWNAVAKPGYNRNNNRFVADSIDDPIFQALRNGLGIEPRIWVCPDPSTQPIAALSTSDYNVPSEPNTWLWGINAISDPGSDADAAGFYVQVTDSLTGATVFSQPMLSGLLYPNRAGGVVAFLSAPRLFVPPAYPIVRVVNLSNSPQACFVNLFCCIETDVQPID